MVRLVSKEWSYTTTKEELVAMESEVLRRLDWELQFICPIFFLERFQRIFGLDLEQHDNDAHKVGALAKKMIRCMLVNSCYLRFKPS